MILSVTIVLVAITLACLIHRMENAPDTDTSIKYRLRKVDGKWQIQFQNGDDKKYYYYKECDSFQEAKNEMDKLEE